VLSHSSARYRVKGISPLPKQLKSIDPVKRIILLAAVTTPRATFLLDFFALSSSAEKVVNQFRITMCLLKLITFFQASTGWNTMVE
jgi:hypothetical protein